MLRNDKIGMVFQNPALWPHRNIRKNISFGLEVRKIDKKVQNQAVDRAIDLVKFYEKEKIMCLNHLADWLDIDLKSLNFLLDQFRNKKFWQQKNINNWKFKGLNYYQKKSNETKNNKNIFKYFKSKKKYKETLKSNYIIFGKGI